MTWPDAYKEINIYTQASKRDEVVNRSGRRTEPQIFIEDMHIEGLDDLAKLYLKGGWMSLLS